MPIVAVEGMVDAQPGAGYVSNVGTPLPGTPYNVFGSNAANRSEVTVSKDADGWLSFVTGPSPGGTGGQVAKWIGVSRPFADLFTFTASSFVYGGVRLKTVINATLLPLVCLHDNRPASMPNAAVNQQVIFNYLDIPGGVVSGTEYYFEWAVDMVNQKYLRRLDGVRLPDIAFASGASAAWLAQGMAICYGSSVSVNASFSTVIGYSIRDIYMGEKIDGETSDWLGPRRVIPMGIKAVDSNWVPSAGTVLSAWNTAITDSASYSAPYVSNNADGSSAKITLDVPDFNGKIDAVAVSAIGRRQSGSLGGAGLSITDGTTEVPAGGKQYTTSMAYYPNPAFIKNPSGQAWTKASLAAITVKLKPIQ